MSTQTFFKTIRTNCWNWRFGLYLAAGLLFFQYSIIGLLLAVTPPDHHWLGATISNTSDVAVYLNYLEQGRDHLFLTNLFSDQPSVPRFDLFWSTAGLLVRAGLPPVAVHELLRVLMTMVLAFVIYATARAVTQTEPHARLTSILLTSGLSTGWIFVIYYTLTHTWIPTSPVPPDVLSEFAVVPILLGGAHMILSLALQLLGIRFIWSGIFKREWSSVLWGSFFILIQTGFHPYFIPLYGLLTLVILFVHFYGRLLTKKIWLMCLTVNAALIPGAAYYVFLAFADIGLRKHHLEANLLPLNSWDVWLITLLLFIPALIWLWRNPVIARSHLKQHGWLAAWLLAAIVCMTLPFPWTRKYTQGLLPVLVLMTLPFWLMIYERIQTSFANWPLKLGLWLVIFFPFLGLFQTQLMMTVNPVWAGYFFNPLPLRHAWETLRDKPSDSLVLTTNINVNLWTTAYASKHVWIGHNHETPDFNNRRDAYYAWLGTEDPEDFQLFLSEHQITHLITLNTTDTAKRGSMLAPDWKKIFEEQGVAVWAKQD